MYDMYSNEISPLIIIEVLNRSYCVSGVLETALKSLDITIEITYLGEYTGSIRMPKNMWVKMTTAEQEAYMQRKDPCIGCELCEKNECSSTAVNAYLSTEGFGKRVSLQDCTCQSLTRIFPLSIEFL
jgi:NAD-dependent dihydropyrimidine dehydrogenase PreA subunit